MKTVFSIGILLSVLLVVAPFAKAQSQTDQQKLASRIATRDKLKALLETSGPKRGINIIFHPSSKQPFNFVGELSAGLKNAEGFEVVVGVSNDETIRFRIYPHYNGQYMNIDKAKNRAGLMRQLLNLNDKNFLFWGADNGGDIFAGYTFTLESGFPDKAIEIVLYSISPLDQYVGEMRANFDGTAAH